MSTLDPDPLQRPNMATMIDIEKGDPYFNLSFDQLGHDEIQTILERIEHKTDNIYENTIQLKNMSKLTMNKLEDAKKHLLQGMFEATECK